ncbi:hypothetical protein ET475_07250 [Microbacterium protaetiae]|uniref:WXG100 family type VII secretion target n=1 Tax=Microbacterium protaetiae TaxID=2509458 RepID=A0A4P6EDK7_9MICO|nr:hypothetical protein [Microbacterium protaetiae]QAY59806.1 hypothetical protein ET475_07250 [Microbacterium protaetiae]
MSGSLVAAPVEASSPFSGAFLIEDGQALADAVQSGNWLEGGVAAFSGVIDSAAAVIDPIGTLIANGLGWVLDHVDPLRGWLDDFTGNAGEVEAFAQTWENIAGRMHESGDALSRRTDDVADMSGVAIDAYLSYAADASRHLSAVGDWAAAIGAGMRVASQVVQIVHDLVRDAVSQIVGTAISVAAETALTLGIAAPFTIGQISTRVASLSATVGRAITRLQRGLKELIRLIGELKGLFARGSGLISRMLRGGGGSLPAGWGKNQRGVLPSGTVFKPGEIRFSQKTVSYRKERDGVVYTYDDILTSMRKRGWQGEAIDVVKMSDGGVTSLDNTRLLAANELGTDVYANVHDLDEALNAAEVDRFESLQHGTPSTWGGAVDIRVAKQGTKWAGANPSGSFELPRVTGRG